MPEGRSQPPKPVIRRADQRPVARVSMSGRSALLPWLGAFAGALLGGVVFIVYLAKRRRSLSRPSQTTPLAAAAQDTKLTPPPEAYGNTPLGAPVGTRRELEPVEDVKTTMQAELLPAHARPTIAVNHPGLEGQNAIAEKTALDLEPPDSPTTPVAQTELPNVTFDDHTQSADLVISVSSYRAKFLTSSSESLVESKDNESSGAEDIGQDVPVLNFEDLAPYGGDTDMLDSSENLFGVSVASDDATMIADETVVADQDLPQVDAQSLIPLTSSELDSPTIRAATPLQGIPAPTIIGPKYKLLEEIASGTFGSVWKAKDLQRDTEVAAKVMHDYAVNIDPEAARRFEREAKTLLRLQHPHIVDVLDIARTEDDEPMLIMELLPGETLAKLHKDNRLELQDVFRIMGQILSALGHAHQQNPQVIHRDLKPSNIFVNMAFQDGPYAKLIDFGVVKWLGDKEHTSLTQQGSAIGTLLYMSPEQALGQEIDARSDLFSAGVILYELLVGFHPFRARDQKKVVPLELVDAIVNHGQHRIHDARFLISRPMHQVIVRALRKRPEDRYPDAATFRDELLQAAESL